MVLAVLIFIFNVKNELINDDITKLPKHGILT